MLHSCKRSAGVANVMGLLPHIVWATKKTASENADICFLLRIESNLYMLILVHINWSLSSPISRKIFLLLGYMKVVKRKVENEEERTTFENRTRKFIKKQFPSSKISSSIPAKVRNRTACTYWPILGLPDLQFAYKNIQSCSHDLP